MGIICKWFGHNFKYQRYVNNDICTEHYYKCSRLNCDKNMIQVMYKDFKVGDEVIVSFNKRKNYKVKLFKTADNGDFKGHLFFKSPDSKENYYLSVDNFVRRVR